TRWEQSESVACSQLGNIVGDTILVKILHSKSVLAMWKVICKELEGKTRMISVDICHRMMETRASKGDNIHVHLESLALSHKHLTRMGATPDAEDYATIILGLLPPTYFDYIFNLASSAQIYRKPLTAEQMINTATERYDSRKVQIEHTKKPSSKDKAFYTYGKCHNCGKKGHYKADCWVKGGGKEGQ
ncbi:hypothetical protein K439DRAFT_1298654, partial [Ramaria rubella]